MTTESLAQVRAPPAQPHRPSPLSDPQDVVRYFRTALGLNEAELTTALGADARSVRRWTSAAAAKEPIRRHAERIDDLRDIAGVLSETLTDEHIGRWLRVRNRMLDGQRPLELLGAGDYDAVRQAAEAYVIGDPQ